MKKLTKISLNGFDELSTQESVQLFGGQEPIPSDSTHVAKPDSTKTPEPPRPNTTHKVIGSSTYNTNNGSSTYSVGYSGSHGNWSWGATVNYNTSSGASIGGTISYNFGGKK